MIVLIKGLLYRETSRFRTAFLELEHSWSTQDELLASINDRIASLFELTRVKGTKDRFKKPAPLPRPKVGQQSDMLGADQDQEANDLALEYLRQFSPGGKGEGSSSIPEVAALRTVEDERHVI
jgi:hypothetical protein